MVRKRQGQKSNFFDFARFRKATKRTVGEKFSLKGIWTPGTHGGKWQSFVRRLQTIRSVRAQRKKFACPPESGLKARLRGKLPQLLGGFVALSCLCFLSIKIFTAVVQKSDYGKVEDVQIVGNEVVKRSDVYRQSGILRHQTSIFTIDESQVAERLETMSWVERARVDVGRTSSIVTITVQEQEPVAIIHNPNQEHSFSYLGRSGDIFAQVQKGEELDFPVITGFTKVAPEYTEKTLDDILAFLKRLSRNNPNLPVHSLSEIHVAQDGKLTLYLVDYSFPIYVGDTEINSAYSKLVKILADIYARPRGIELSKIGYIQLDYMKDRVLVAENGSN